VGNQRREEERLGENGSRPKRENFGPQRMQKVWRKTKAVTGSEKRRKKVGKKCESPITLKALRMAFKTSPNSLQDSAGDKSTIRKMKTRWIGTEKKSFGEKKGT